MQYEKVKEWYGRSDVKFEIIKSLFNREMAILVPSWVKEDGKNFSTRMLRCHSVQHLDYILQKGLRVWDKNMVFNIYYSLARYRIGIPMQTFNFSERNNLLWNKEHFEDMQSYDFLIDIDAGDFEDIDMTYNSTKNIVNFFNKSNVPFELRFSGKGFHIIIPYIYFSLSNNKFNPNDKHNIYNLYFNTARKIYNKFSEMIDLKIYDSRRLCKIPFSLSIYKDNIYVCYPFSELDDFYNFKLEDFELMKFEKSVRQKKRTVFNEDGNIRKLLKAI